MARPLPVTIAGTTRLALRLAASIRLVRQFDLIFIAVPILFSLLSLVILYSVSATGHFELFTSQVVFIGIGLGLFVLLLLLDYRNLRAASILLYITSLVLLLVVLIVGKTTGGATRWLDFGPFQLQPSELMKFSLVLILASQLCLRGETLTRGELGRLGLLILLPGVLTILEPDVGSAALLLLSSLPMLSHFHLERSAKRVVLAIGLLGFLVFMMSLFQVGPIKVLLKDYQRERVFSFIAPSRDPYGAGYNLRQSLISVGSGGLFGRGLGAASQSELKFLPIPHTDFIFASIAETFGFVGSSLVLLLYLVFLARILQLARSVEDRFGSLLALGIGGVFFFEIGVNIGMNLGLLPVAGVPLPFLSHGGSQTVTSFIMVGVLESIYRKRQVIRF